MKLSTLLFVLSLFVFSFQTSDLLAQKSLLIHTGIALPTGDFASNIGNDAGDAALGISLGVQYNQSFGNSWLSYYVSTDFMFNWLQKDTREAISAGNTLADFQFSKYINIPVGAGLRIEFPSNSGVQFYLQGGPVFNFFTPTRFTTIFSTAGGITFEEVEQTFNGAFRTGAKLGLGLILPNGLELSVTNLSLNNYEITGTLDNGVTSELDREVDILQVTLGVPLW